MSDLNTRDKAILGLGCITLLLVVCAVIGLALGTIGAVIKWMVA